MFVRVLVLMCLIIGGLKNCFIMGGEHHNYKQEDISLIRNQLLTNISSEHTSLLQNEHPVMVLAINKFNETISNIIEIYLQVFDPVLLSDETCSTSLRTEAWKFLRKNSDGGFYCLNQLNSQLLATSRIREYVPLTDCLTNYEKKSTDKLESYGSTVKLCTYFLNVPIDRLNLDPTGISSAIRKQRINQS